MVGLPSVSATTRPRAEGYDGYLNDLLLRFVLDGQNQIRIRSAKRDNELPELADQPEEVGGSRSREALVDLTGGSNLFFGQRPSEDPRDRTRFWDSSGIDNAPRREGQQQGIRLLRDTENAVSDTSTNPHMVVIDDTVYFGDGNQVTRATTILGTPGTTTEDPHTGTQNVLGLAVLGDEVYAACGTDGIGKRSSAGSWSDLASAPAEVLGVWAAKRRILADTNGAIEEINLTTGAGTSVVSLPSGVTVTDVADAGPAILVAATNGVVYSLTDSGGSLTIAAETRLAAYEYPNVLWSAFGQIMVGSTVPGSAGDTGRLYVGRLGSETEAYALADLQLLYELDAPPTAATQRKDSVYVATVATSTTELWRYHLATGSLTRDLEFATAAEAFGLQVVDDRLVIARTGEGVDREMDSYVASGYLISSAYDFFTDVDKAWLELVTEGALPSGTQISVYATTDLDDLNDPTSAGWQLIQRINSAASLGFRASIPGTSSRYLAIKVTMTSEAGTQVLTPIVSSVTIVAEPSTSEIIVQVPVNVSDRIERPYRKPITLKGWGRRVLQELLSRAGDPVTIGLYREELVVKGSVIGVDAGELGTGIRAGRSLVALLTVQGEIESSGSATALFSGTTLGPISLDGTVTLGA